MQSMCQTGKCSGTRWANLPSESPESLSSPGANPLYAGRPYAQVKTDTKVNAAQAA